MNTLSKKYSGGVTRYIFGRDQMIAYSCRKGKRGICIPEKI